MPLACRQNRTRTCRACRGNHPTSSSGKTAATTRIWVKRS
jgi:hypothetical protein